MNLNKINSKSNFVINRAYYKIFLKKLNYYLSNFKEEKVFLEKLQNHLYNKYLYDDFIG